MYYNIMQGVPPMIYPLRYLLRDYNYAGDTAAGKLLLLLVNNFSTLIHYIYII